MAKSLKKFDRALLKWDKSYADEFARGAMSLIFLWFGFLKVISVSPAADLVHALLAKVLPFMPFELFFLSFGLFEMAIGVLFLVPKWTRLAILVLILHMTLTFLPILLLPEVTWQAPGVLTLEGQYIVKNVAIVALAMTLGLTLKPLKRRR